MIARIASIPLVAWLAYVLYMVFLRDEAISPVWMVPPVILLAAIWVSSRELDQWFLGDRNKDLDEESIQWLTRFSIIYQELSEEKRQQLRFRIHRIINDSMFMAMSGEKFPDDAGLALAHDQALLTLTNHYDIVENYVLYAHPFLTPNIPDKVHTCEYEPEDKVIIVSAEQMLPGFLSPREYLNISMYAHGLGLFANRAFVREFGNIELPSAQDSIGILGLDEQLVINWLGLHELDKGALALCAYVYDPVKLSGSHPKTFHAFEKLLGIHG